jgi:SAM-dependent methyltransferase
MNLKSLLRLLKFTLLYWKSEPPPWDTGVSPPELMSFIEGHRAGRAIDMGCGTGTNSITLARYGWEVIGIDFVSRAVREARRKARRAGLRINFRVGDVTRLNGVEGPFELVLDIGCFHGLADGGRRRYLDSLERILAPGGSFLLYVFFRENREASGPGVIEADLDEIAGLMKLVSRSDGSERGTRPAAWLEYKKDE